MRQIRSFIIALFLPVALFAGGSPTDEELLKEFYLLRAAIVQIIGKAKFIALREEAMEQIRLGNFENFDPLVGDTSCELRSLFALFMRRGEVVGDDMRDLAAFVYILGQAVDMGVNEDDGFLTTGGGKDNPTTLSKVVGISSQAVRKGSLMFKLKRIVAYGSVIFARRQARIESSVVCPFICDLFDNQCCFDAEQRPRPLLCCSGVVRLQIECARRCRFPIVLRVRLAGTGGAPSLGTVIVAYIANDEGRFVETNPDDIRAETMVVLHRRSNQRLQLWRWDTTGARYDS
jgi:hypothetical protein